MKKSTMVILLALAVILIAAGVVVGGAFGWSYSPVSGEYAVLLQDDTGSITSIRVELLSCSIRVYTGWDDELSAEGSGLGAVQVSAARNGSELVLTESAPTGLRRYISTDRYNDYVVLWLPENFAGELTLSTVSGETTLSSLQYPGTRAAITTVSGELDVYDSSLDTLSVESVSGDIWINAIVANRVSVHTVSGDIFGVADGYDEPIEVDVNSVSGDIHFDY